MLAQQLSSSIKPNVSGNVISRLRWRIQDASQLGFHVRTEPLDGRTAAWCQIGRRKVIFLDLTVSAIEQLEQLEDVLTDYQRDQQTIAVAESKAA